MFLFGSIVYRRRTHLLRRLLLDGARFDQTGNAWAYAVRHVLTAFAVPATLGWAGPWRMQRLSTRLVREMTFDGRPFSYSGSARALYRPFVTLWLGGVGLYLATLLALGTTIGADIMHAAEIGSLGPLLSVRVGASGVPILATGLLSFAVLARAYRAEVLNNHVSHIAWGATRFKLSVPPVDYAMVSLAGSALRVLTLGVLSPVADAQMWRLMARHLDIEGPPLTARRD